MGFLLTILPAIVSLLGILPSLIQEAEKAFTGAPGSGAAKKQLVLDTLTAGLAVAPVFGANISPSQQQAITGVASALIDSTVAGLNAAQVFQNCPHTVAPRSTISCRPDP